MGIRLPAVEITGQESRVRAGQPLTEHPAAANLVKAKIQMTIGEIRYLALTDAKL